MTLEAFKLLFAHRPESPEGVEFWEWRPASERMQETPVLTGDFAKVGVWSQGGARVDYVWLYWPPGVRTIYYRAQCEGVVTA